MCADDRTKGQGGSPDSEQLLRDAERLQRILESTEDSQRRKHKQTAAAGVERQVTSVHKAFVQTVAAAQWIWANVVSPVVTHPVARRAVSLVRTALAQDRLPRRR